MDNKKEGVKLIFENGDILNIYDSIKNCYDLQEKIKNVIQNKISNYSNFKIFSEMDPSLEIVDEESYNLFLQNYRNSQYRPRVKIFTDDISKIDHSNELDDKSPCVSIILNSCIGADYFQENNDNNNVIEEHNIVSGTGTQNRSSPVFNNQQKFSDCPTTADSKKMKKMIEKPETEVDVSFKKDLQQSVKFVEKLKDSNNMEDSKNNSKVIKSALIEVKAEIENKESENSSSSKVASIYNTEIDKFQLLHLRLETIENKLSSIETLLRNKPEKNDNLTLADKADKVNSDKKLLDEGLEERNLHSQCQCQNTTLKNQDSKGNNNFKISNFLQLCYIGLIVLIISCYCSIENQTDPIVTNNCSCDKEIYLGPLKEGKKFGEGNEKYKDNIIFKGNYIEDKKNGKGVYYYNDYEQRYEGYWKEDKKVGVGKIFYKNGDFAEKNWDLKNNDVIYNFKTGEIYKGGFARNMKNGYGIFYNTKGIKMYEGEWLDDKPHGKGILYYQSGSIFEGKWVNGKRVDNGLLISGKKKYVIDFNASGTLKFKFMGKV